MLAFIDPHRERYGVESIGAVLPIAPSTYSAHKARAVNPERVPPRAKRDARLQLEIRRVWEENFQVYGVRKRWRQLGREGIYTARCTVARLRREMGLRGVVRGRRVKTTQGDKAQTQQSCYQPPFEISLCLHWVSENTCFPTGVATGHQRSP
jgi:hypothetical protein